MESPGAGEWLKEIDNEKAQFHMYNVLTPVKWESFPKGAKVLTTTWAMRLKANVTHRGRLNARGHNQVDGSHYASDYITAPVTNPSLFELYWCYSAWIPAGHQQSSMLKENSFKDTLRMGKNCTAKSLMVFRWCSTQVNVPLYWTKQAAYCFFKTFARYTKKMSYKKSKADPCLYFFMDR